jgi:hypothetical protein
MAAQDALNSSLMKGNISTAAFVVGGVGLATGAVLLIVRPFAKKKTAPRADPEADSARIEPWIGLRSAGISGRF